MSKPLHVLIVEDSESDAAMVVHLLRKAGYDVHDQRVESADQMQAALEKQAWDVVISDYSLPQFDAPAALALLQQTGLDIPFIVVSGTIGEETAVTMMKTGTHDYFMKNKLARLAPAVEREIREAQMRQERKRGEEALRESEARYRAFTESAMDAIITANSKGNIVSWNRGAQQIFGYNTSEMFGQPLVRIMPVRYHDSYQGRMWSTDDKGDPGFTGKTVELYGLRKDGSEVPLELSHAEWETGQGKFFTSILRDITERKRVEGQVQRQIKRLVALRTIDTAITSGFDLRVTLGILLEQATTQLGVDTVDILLLNAHTQTLDYAAGRGYHSSALQNTHLRVGEGYAGCAALERHAVHVPNIIEAGGDLAHVPPLEDEAFLAYYGVPLIAKGQVKGVLEILNRTPLDLDDEWMTFLEMLTNQAAITIDNLELFDRLQRSNIELVLAYDTTLEGWSQALDLRDKESENHSQRVTEMTLRLAQAMGLNGEELVHIRRGALLHDIGKLGIPDNILLKPDVLTQEERVVIQRHPVYAYEWLSPITYLRLALDIPYCHHENWDGSGYPRGLKGKAIPLAARIFAIVDVWDALHSDRTYRPAWPTEKVREHIRSLSGIDFDPQVVEAFFKVMQGDGLPSYIDNLSLDDIIAPCFDLSR
ncbi:MAG: PAS domain S-box protein [Anaerolineales bacterium]|nr:PAS domain S-box protein [Anaerolineales bacterium]